MPRGRVIAFALLAIPLTVGAVPGDSAGGGDGSSIIDASQLGWPGWTDAGCRSDERFDSCVFSHPSAWLGMSAWPIGETGQPQLMVDGLATIECDEASTPLDVGAVGLTVGCSAQDGDAATSFIVFANDSWVFTVNLTEHGGVPWETPEFLLDVRQRQLALAGGEAAAAAPQVRAPDSSGLDRFLPVDGPPGFAPAGGITLPIDAFENMAPDDLGWSSSQTDFIRSHITTRVRMWLDDDAYSAAVVVTEYPYQEFAGLAIDGLDEPPASRIDASAAAQVDDLVAVETDGVSGPIVVEGFRRGRREVTVLVSGPDVATNEQVASALAVDVAGLLPPGGESAAIHPPSVWTSVIQAAAATALLVVTILLLRRALAGRAARPPPLDAGDAHVDDVSPAARALRRRGHALAAIQVVACAVVVVGIVADIGWWSIVVAAAGVALGAGATTIARRRELEGALRYRVTTSRTAVVFGLLAATLLVGGVALSVRGVKELALLPSLTHLRMADRFTVAPDVLAVVMVAVGLVALVAGAFVIRLARAHARTTGARRTDPRPPILYLRSFDDDRLDIPSVHSARRPFAELFSLSGRDAFEESIAWELAANGPVVAVGHPARSTASLGAARELLDPATWQRDVAERMRGAAAIVLAVGDTPGLAWEVGEIVRSGHLPKTHFIVPPADRAAVVERWAATCDAIHRAVGRLVVPPVDIADSLTARIETDTGAVTLTWADRIDEAAYRAAVDRALATPTPGSATS